MQKHSSILNLEIWIKDILERSKTSKQIYFNAAEVYYTHTHTHTHIHTHAHRAGVWETESQEADETQYKVSFQLSSPTLSTFIWKLILISWWSRSKQHPSYLQCWKVLSSICRRGYFFFEGPYYCHRKSGQPLLQDPLLRKWGIWVFSRKSKQGHHYHPTVFEGTALEGAKEM